MPLSDVKTIGRGLSCSVNDVLLACVAGAIGAYLRDHGDDPAGKEIRAMVPVNLRPLDKAWQLGINKQTAARSSVSVKKAEVARAQAALDRFETDLRNSTIVSPMDGLALSRDVEVGKDGSPYLLGARIDPPGGSGRG